MRRIVLITILIIAFQSGWTQEIQSLRHFEQITQTSIDDSGYFYHTELVQSKSATAEIINEVWQIASLRPGMQLPESTFQYHTGRARKENIIGVKIPMYKEESNQIYFLQSFDLKIKDIETPKLMARPEYPTNSVLATGNWYKIGITQRGVYKIDAAFLNNIGINTTSLNPKNIRIYGNGGQVLNETPDDSEPNDLVENAIYVSTSGTSFGSSDYVLFYADGPRKWQHLSFTNTFEHQNNYYSDTAYYFINVDKGPGKRISDETISGTPTITFDQFDNYAVIDNDEYQPTTMGKIWWSNRMSTQSVSSQTQDLEMLFHHPVGPVLVEYDVASNIEGGSNTITIAINGTVHESVTLGSASAYIPMTKQYGDFNTDISDEKVKIQLKLFPAGTGSAYLNYIRINGKSHLNLNGINQLNFRNAESKSYTATDVIAYQISNTKADAVIWNVTNKLHPINMPKGGTGTTTIIKDYGGKLNEYIAFTKSTALSPKFIGKVENQNLHAMPSAELIIITPDGFIPVAEKIKALHQELDGINVNVVTTQQIYNEFSSGGQDITAIRNFLRMFYDRATTPESVPENVLLLGSASYDYKDRIENNTNFVPTFQSLVSDNFYAAFVTDDYYVLLDSNEIIGSTSSFFDMGIGRIPINTLEEGEAIVQKIKNYLSNASFGAWKNEFTFVSDDYDIGWSTSHSNDAEVISGFLEKNSPNYNLLKLYGDAYPLVASGSGTTLPGLTNDLKNKVFTGTFMVLYTGHGSPSRLSQQNILTLEDIKNWNNFNKLPVVITGTCDFGRFDNPAEASGGKSLFIKKDGGSIASVTTTQLVYPTSSTNFISQYIDIQFNRDSKGELPTMGQAMIKGKNAYSGASHNNIKYALLGDPALKLAIPKYHISTDSLLLSISETETKPSDTIKSLGKYTIKGSVKDFDGNVITGFNGTVNLTIFDKPRENKFLHPIAPPSFTSYQTQNSVIYKGAATVKDGMFQFTFVVPKDINYDFGKGKMSFYAASSTEDAAGADTGFIVGGFSEYAIQDNEGPIVKPFIDDTMFKDGGVTGPDPILYVQLYDDNGINVTGSSIGHDLVAIMDGNTEEPFILNNFYSTAPNDYQNGSVTFQLNNIPEGEHEITVKAWDVFNNSGTGSVRFKVVNKDKAAISDIYCYPNPMTNGYTNFVIQHNLSNLDVTFKIRIFNNSGRVVRTLEDHFKNDANRTEVRWDGSTEYGIGLPAGVYFYQLEIIGPNNISTSAYNKLTIIR